MVYDTEYTTDLTERVKEYASSYPAASSDRHPALVAMEASMNENNAGSETKKIPAAAAPVLAYTPVSAPAPAPVVEAPVPVVAATTAAVEPPTPAPVVEEAKKTGGCIMA